MNDAYANADALAQAVGKAMYSRDTAVIALGMTVTDIGHAGRGRRPVTRGSESH